MRNETKHQLSSIVLSGVRITPKGISSLAKALARFPHGLPTLSLKDVNVASSGMDEIVTAFRQNWGMSLTLQVLDLTGCQLTGEEFAKFVKATSHISLCQLRCSF